MSEPRPTWEFISAELREGGALTLENKSSIRTFKLSAGVDKPKPLPLPQVPPITLYSQRDPRWSGEVYAGNKTFAEAGCYVTCVAMIASLAGYTDTPPECAAKLAAAQCFSGDLLTLPQRIPNAYPKLCYEGTHTWHTIKADLSVFWNELREGPMIAEVDFRPTTKEFNQHFVVVLDWDEAAADVLIADPWDGTISHLVKRYALVWYALGKTVEASVCGLRLLRPA